LIMVTHEQYVADMAERSIFVLDGKIEKDKKNGFR
jgi:ABC-type lipoprotein export system ATPase subunit